MKEEKQMKGEEERMKSIIKMQKTENKRNNINSTSSNNACPLSITIKVSNTNGWEYR